jgi:hypothetical protein
MKDLSEKQSPSDALGGVLERFHLQLNDDEADLLIRGGNTYICMNFCVNL